MKIINRQHYRKGYNECVLTVQDGNEIRRITPATLQAERREKNDYDFALRLLGTRVAQYDETHGAFIGTVSRVCKRHFVVTTRGGVKINLPNCAYLSVDTEMTFEEWDARLERAKIELPACNLGNPRFTL